MKEKIIDERVMKYGLTDTNKVCNCCKRENHEDNTHCWYCKGKFI